MSEPAQSPPKDVDQAAQSPEDDGQLNEEVQVAMEYEGVKEQDRWLPIANGMYSSFCSYLAVSFPLAVVATSPLISLVYPLRRLIAHIP